MAITQDGGPMPHAEQAARLCAAGVRFLQLRMKDVARAEWLATAREVAAICRANGALCIINDSVEIALEVGADGAHLGQKDMDWGEARRRLGPGLILGGTVNRLHEAEKAVRAGCLDYVGIGPLRFTRTKKELAPLQGYEGLRGLLGVLGEIPAWAYRRDRGRRPPYHPRTWGLRGRPSVPPFFATTRSTRMCGLSSEPWPFDGSPDPSGPRWTQIPSHDRQASDNRRSRVHVPPVRGHREIQLGQGHALEPRGLGDAACHGALRRVRTDGEPDDIVDHLEPERYRLMPNTSGVRDAREAVLAAELAREALETNWLKLEIHPDPKYLMPDPIETLAATRELVKRGFIVLPYVHADPVLCKQLEEAGAAAVMPLGAPIGSNRGLESRAFLEIIIAQARVPVVVDAGLGAPSHAAAALEMGADAVLVNTAIAAAADPVAMADAFRRGVEAGRMAFEAGLSGICPRRRPARLRR